MPPERLHDIPNLITAIDHLAPVFIIFLINMISVSPLFVSLCMAATAPMDDRRLLIRKAS